MSFKSLSEVLSDVTVGEAKAWMRRHEETTHLLAQPESPIEDAFCWAILKYIRRDEVKVEAQKCIRTKGGSYRIDFMLTKDGRSIGIECDGEKWHPDRAKDRIRDQDILSTGEIAVIYHFRGKDLFNHVEECIKILSECEFKLFDDRALDNLVSLTECENGYWGFRNEYGGQARRWIRRWNGDGKALEPRDIYVKWRGRSGGSPEFYGKDIWDAVCVETASAE